MYNRDRKVCADFAVKTVGMKEGDDCCRLDFS